MSIYALTQDAVFRCLVPLNGIELSRAREISKIIKSLIDKKEAILFHQCMLYEFPKECSKFQIDGYNRQDWKNIYIATDQYNVMNKRSNDHKKVLTYHRDFKKVEVVIMSIEMVLGCLTGFCNFIKVASLGWSASRAAINLFLKDNPGSNVSDAIKALDIKVLINPSLPYDRSSSPA